MLPQFLVRIGVLGQVGRFTAVGDKSFGRGDRVVCRTRRGLEIGEVLSPASQTSFDADGSVLRHVVMEDDLLIARLARKKNEAFAECTRLLTQRGCDEILLDVEHLFDGRGLYFYFLGEISDGAGKLTNELAEIYGSAVEFRQFADALETGCGPGCGTSEAENGCKSGSCGSCQVAEACSSHH